LGPKKVGDDALAFLGEGIGVVFGLRPSDEVVVDMPKGRIHRFTRSDNLVSQEVIVGELLIIGNIGVIEHRNKFEITAGDASALSASAKACVAQKEGHNLANMVDELFMGDWVGEGDSDARDTTEIGVVKCEQHRSSCRSGFDGGRRHGFI